MRHSTVVVLMLLPLLAAAPLEGQAPNVPDLSGRWDDGGRPVEIRQSGRSLTAVFLEPPLCDPQDGSAPKPRELDFEGSFAAGDTIRGEAVVCNYGESWGAEIGIQRVDMWLVPSADGTALAGEYDGMDGWAEFGLTREECDPELWEEYRRKEAVALELLAHARDLMRTRTGEAEDFVREFVKSVGVEIAGDIPTDAAIRRSKDHYLREFERIFEDVGVLGDSQGRMLSPGYRGAAAVKTGTTLAFVAEQLYYAVDTARRLEATHAEANEAFAQAADLLEQALEDFRAASEQMEACARRADEERKAEELLERAKALRDEWDLGTGLYRDAEGGIHDAAGALERAKQIVAGMEAAGSEAASAEAAGRARAEIRTAITRFGVGMDALANRLAREAEFLETLERMLEERESAEAPAVG